MVTELVTVKWFVTEMATFGERLREERARLGKSQEELGVLAGSSKVTQSRYEGDKRFPDAAYFEAIAAVGVDVGYILTGQRTPVAAPLVVAEAPAAYRVDRDPAGISPREAALLDNYRACGEEDQRAIDQVVLTAAEAKRPRTTVEKTARVRRRA